MKRTPHMSIEVLIEIARQQGIGLDAARALDLRARVESLLARLARVTDGLERGRQPAPGGPPRRPT